MDTSSSQQLALPRPTGASKRRKRVLTEEEYVNGIEAIIERDFFPDVPLLKAKLAELKTRDARRQNEVGELFTVAPPFSSIAGKPAPTPALTQPAGTALQTPVVAGSHSPELDNSQETSAGPSAPKVSLDVFLSHHTSEDNASFGELHEETLQRKRLKVQHLLEFPKPSEQHAPVTYIDWPFNPKNKLFYDVSVTGDVPYTKFELGARVQGPPKEILHENTRLPMDFDLERRPELKPGQDYHLPGVGVVDQPQRALLSTPVPIPGKNMTPIMTWGELAATPIRLDRTPGFTIKAASERDVIGRKMASSARRSLQRRAARYTPSSVRRTPKMLSAAGKKLASVLHKAPGTDLQLRASYSGTPCRRSSRSTALRSVTPISRPKIKKEATQTSGKITDDLLK